MRHEGPERIAANDGGPGSDDVAPKCAEWARREGVALGGTANSCDGYLLVEWPVPWPRDASDVPALAGVLPMLAERGIRLQLVRAESTPSSAPRLVLYSRPEGKGFRGFDGVETTVAGGLDELAGVAARLVGGGEAPMPGAHPVGTSIDVLVCGHGTRDVCCGSLGTGLVRRMAARSSARRAGPVRLWRTTHLGGHRFAPTAVTLPDGIVWGRLDTDSLAAIVDRAGPASDVAHLVRGCSGLRSPAAQLLDRALLAHHGWGWLAWERSGHDLDASTVQIEAFGVGSEHVAWEAYVVEGRDLPVPPCRSALTGAEKHEREILLGAYRPLRA